MDLRHLFALVSLLFIMACRPEPLCIKVTDTRVSHLTLRFEEEPGCQKSAITSVTFLSQVGGQDKSILWNIGVVDKAKELSTLTYGVMPEGFSGVTATKLHPGETIRVSVQALGTNGGLDLTVTE